MINWIKRIFANSPQTNQGYQCDSSTDPSKSEAASSSRENNEPTKLYWAYLHSNQSIHVKEWYAGNQYLKEAVASDLVALFLTEPFKASSCIEAEDTANRFFKTDETPTRKLQDLFQNQKASTLGEIQNLINNGANLNVANDAGITSLFQAVSEGDCKIVSALIKAGANVNTSAPNGMTPLYIAAQEGHLNIAKILLKAGCTLNDEIHMNGMALTPLRFAEIFEQPNIARLIRKYGGD